MKTFLIATHRYTKFREKALQKVGIVPLYSENPGSKRYWSRSLKIDCNNMQQNIKTGIVHLLVSSKLKIILAQSDQAPFMLQVSMS